MLHGLMMDTPLLITSIMQFAETSHAAREIVSVTADNPRHRYSYADAFGRARQLANVLDTLGLEAGDRVGTLAWNDHRHFELYYAASCSGRVCHTINPRLFPEQIAYIINHAGDRVLFVDPMFVPLVEALADRVPRVEAFVVMTDAAHMPDTRLPNVHVLRDLARREPKPNTNGRFSMKTRPVRCATRPGPPVIRRACCTATVRPCCTASELRCLM